MPTISNGPWNFWIPVAASKLSAAWMQDALRDGFQALEAGKTQEAADICRRLIGAKPDLTEAHFLVGLVAIELKDRSTAIQAFGSVTELDPRHGAAWAQLARLFMQAGQPLRADAALESAIQFEDGNPVVADLIGSVYSILGDQREALQWFGKAAAKSPRTAAFRVNHANCQMYLGNLDEAGDQLREVLKMQPFNPNAHWILAGLKKATDRDHVDEMQKLVATCGYPPQALAFMQYAIGKEFEDLEQWDDAFDAFAAGAKARRTTIEYDEAAEVAMYDALEKIYTREWLESGPAGRDDPSPVFVVGQPRTGTTLVERIITAHSAVYSAGELRQFGNSFRRLMDYREPKRFSARLVEEAATVDPAALGEAYIRSTAKIRGSTPLFVDKLPSNFLYLPLILKALPNAKIVHLRRNPMDACFSSFKQLFADAYPHSYEQAEIARHHARYFHLMEYWRERFGDRFHEVEYEKIAADVEPNARALIEFLGLPWEEACLNFHQQTSAVTTASAVQVRQPAHTKSIGRWKRYEKHLAPMRQTLQEFGIPF
ncbi:MAG: tetratricopeptide repeat protein [Woeseiaceae bacterium]|nr:tetratricopeptide repeat protein [Woeseiaceae bacterium]